MRSGNLHYRAEEVGDALGFPGAGILAWLTADQLHPPMLNDEEMWRDGSRWAQGAREYVCELGLLAGIETGTRVLDIGCGLCGPARVLVDRFGATVTAISNSIAHVATSRVLNGHCSRHRDGISVHHVKGPETWPERRVDVAWSLNMLYQVPDHREFYGRVGDLLVPAGRFLVDDWMATDLMTESDLRDFGHHFQYRGIARISQIESELVAAGFYPAAHVVDRGEVGRGPMRRHFEPVMTGHFLPRLLARWPDGDGTGVSGRRMVRDFLDAVNLTLDLYASGKLTYRTIVAVKR
ncbi:MULTISPECIES: SAM-dependent methyltransferase [Streptomyces]|uniref:Methyltransferase domain-containing protein n=1 Tax=Streptomyces sudanensis TaxID=436397 RepID=A0ABY4TF21_9ACTN|nr:MULTISPECIES: methyltransferase domain-containing protein [Streptomyces]URN16141.1 methyltransferase domain-containing protein [Streptomyces sudanensis]